MAKYSQKIKFHCPIKMGYPMQNLNDNQSAWSISMGTLQSIYGEGARKQTQTKTGKDSAQLHKNLTAEVRYEVVFNVLHIGTHLPFPIIPQPDHNDTQLCDLIKARTS